MSLAALPESPRYAYGRRLIDLLRRDPDLASYVYPSLYASRQQDNDIKLAVDSNDGVIVVIPDDMSNPTSRDKSIRDGWMECTYVIACGVWRGTGMDDDGLTAAEATDRLAALVISLVQGMTEDDNTPAAPSIVTEGELAIELGPKEVLYTRGIAVSKMLHYPAITLTPEP